ncbi:MAG: hypothetical protein NC408_00035 [Candidatus Gastranaerophilales bacterium]|nr:hypothetical protein [Candidatus Gastranaerophilales bacterium]MCM1072677.1 hypothetical protein [Bacteroides sp.]
MVDFSKISADLRARVEDALKLNAGGDNKKVDSKAEYDALSKLLSGCDKKSEAYRYIDDLMFDGLESTLISPAVRAEVRDIISRGDATLADRKSEIDDLKNLKKRLKQSGELTDEVKTYIDKVIKQHAIGLEEAEETKPEVEQEPVKPEPPTAQPEPKDPPKTQPQPKPAPSKPEDAKEAVGNGNNGHGNGKGNVGNGHGNVGNAGRDIKNGNGSAVGNGNKTSVGNNTNQHGTGNVSGDGNSVNINTQAKPRDKYYRPF